MQLERVIDLELRGMQELQIRGFNFQTDTAFLQWWRRLEFIIAADYYNALLIRGVWNLARLAIFSLEGFYNTC